MLKRGYVKTSAPSAVDCHSSWLLSSIGVLALWSINMAVRADAPFDPIAWFEENKIDASQLNLRQGWYTYGPMDACRLVKLREITREHVETGPAVPADLFILSMGEPRDRSRTKIGGLPYWSKDRPWPKSSTGEPIPFMAQFNLSDSRDLIGGTEGDILLIFAHANPRLGCVIRWETRSTSLRLVSKDDIPVTSEASAPFYGTRWRTENFPNWKRKQHQQTGASWIKLDDGRIIRGSYFIYELVGMQIGRSGFIPPELVFEEGEQIVCSLGGLAFFPEQPYPFLNVPDAISTGKAEELLMPLSNISDSDGFAIIFVVEDRDGKYRCVLKNF